MFGLHFTKHVGRYNSKNLALLGGVTKAQKHCKSSKISRSPKLKNETIGELEARNGNSSYYRYICM